MQEFLSQFDWCLFSIALVFMGLDIVSGFAQAVINSTVESSKIWKGLMHKGVLIFIVVFAVVCQIAAPMFDLPDGFNALYPAACGVIVIMECVSIVENIRKTGAIDSKLLDKLFSGLPKEEK